MTFTGRLFIVVSTLLVPGGGTYAQTPLPATPAPVMTEELMGRLIKYTRAVGQTSPIAPPLCAVLGLCDGSKWMPMKLVKSGVTGAEHVFGVPLEAGSKDILIMVSYPDGMYAYLTDKTGKLRVAAIFDRTGVRLIDNEAAEKGFKAELAVFAPEAAELPPTGTTPVAAVSPRASPDAQHETGSRRARGREAS